MIIALRPAMPADSESLLFELHKAAMGDYITAIWGSGRASPAGLYTARVAPDRWQIITADGADIGMLDVEYRASEIYIVPHRNPSRSSRARDRHSTWSPRC